MEKFDNDYGCATWVEAFIRAVLQRANVHATEIYVEDMDETDIFLRVKELGTDSRKQIEMSYTIRYFDDDMAKGCLLLLYVLYRDGDFCSERLGIGVCKIEGGNTYQCDLVER